MKDGVRLSLRGGSGLSIETLLFCPRKFQIVRDGWRQRYTKLYFVEGALFHDNIEKIIKGELDPNDEEKIKEIEDILLSGKRMDRDRMVEFDTEEYEYKSNVRKVDNAVKRVRLSLNKFDEEFKKGSFGKVLDTEQFVEMKLLVDPMTGKSDDESKRIADAGITFSGRIDLVNEEGIGDYKLMKFAGENKLPNPNTSEQLSIYGYGRTITIGSIIDKVTFHIFTKHVTKCEYYMVEASRTKEDYRETFLLLKRAGWEYLTGEKNGYSKLGKMQSECRDKFNQLCDFFPLCFPQRYDPKELKEARKNIIKIK